MRSEKSEQVAELELPVSSKKGLSFSLVYLSLSRLYLSLFLFYLLSTSFSCELVYLSHIFISVSLYSLYFFFNLSLSSSLSLSLNFSFFLSLSLSYTVSFSLSHTHTLYRSNSLFSTPSHSFSVSFTLSIWFFSHSLFIFSIFLSFTIYFYRCLTLITISLFIVYLSKSSPPPNATFPSLFLPRLSLYYVPTS